MIPHFNSSNKLPVNPIEPVYGSLTTTKFDFEDSELITKAEEELFSDCIESIKGDVITFCHTVNEKGEVFPNYLLNKVGNNPFKLTVEFNDRNSNTILALTKKVQFDQYINEFDFDYSHQGQLKSAIVSIKKYQNPINGLTVLHS